MAWDRLDFLFKLAQNRRPTSTAKRVLEETAGFAQILLGQQLFQEVLDSDPAVAVTSGHVVKDELLVLAADPTTPTGEENSIWLTGNEDYIPPNIVPGDLGYTTRLYDNSNVFLVDGKMDEYGIIFVHKYGVALVQDPIGFQTEFSFPLKVTAYRYTGGKGAGASRVVPFTAQTEVLVSHNLGRRPMIQIQKRASGGLFGRGGFGSGGFGTSQFLAPMNPALYRLYHEDNNTFRVIFENVYDGQITYI